VKECQLAKKLEEGDEERNRYLEALENGYRCHGYVNFDKDRASSPIAKHLGFGERAFIDLMINYLRSGGRLDQVDESRSDWKYWRFHFDLWAELAAKELYVETRFVDDADLDKREIIVVSVHPPGDVTWSRWDKK
jgi:hypothetical protein